LVRARTLKFHGAVVEEIQEKRAEQSRAEQSRAEQSRAEQSRAEQSRAEQSRADKTRDTGNGKMEKWRNGKKARGKSAAMMYNVDRTGIRGGLEYVDVKNGNTVVCWIF